MSVTVSRMCATEVVLIAMGSCCQPRNGRPTACQNRRRADRDDDAGDGAGPRCGTLKAWARAIDDGPFSSLCWGERIAFDNPEAVTLLGALAAWTDRVRLVTTVMVPQLHDPVMLAKASRPATCSAAAG